TLKQATKSIGYYDVWKLILDIIWLIISSAGAYVFFVPTKYYWLVFIRIAVVECPRVLAFIVAMKTKFSMGSRLAMFLVRIITIAFSIVITVCTWNFYAVSKGIWGYE